MKILRKWIILLPLGVTILSLLFFNQAYQQIVREKVQQRLTSIRRDVDLIATYLDYSIAVDKDWGIYHYDYIINQQVNYLDMQPWVFAASYDENLKVMQSSNYNEYHQTNKPFNPLNYSLISKNIQNVMGEEQVSYSDGVSRAYDMYVYWRWIPSGKQTNKILIMTAVNEYSVDDNFASLIVWGVGIIVLAEFILESWMIFRIKNSEVLLRKEKR